eukprot:7144091-Heterocapsa_arctica.AAC.1
MWASKSNVFDAQDWISSSELVQNDQGSARNVMVTARMPEDRSKTIKNFQTLYNNLQSHIRLYAYTCRAH